MQEREVLQTSCDNPPVDCLVYADLWNEDVQMLMETLGQAQQDGMVGTDGDYLPIDNWIDAGIEAKVMQARARIADLVANQAAEGLDDAIKRMLDEGDVTE